MHGYFYPGIFRFRLSMPATGGLTGQHGGIWNLSSQGRTLFIESPRIEEPTFHRDRRKKRVYVCVRGRRVRVALDKARADRGGEVDSHLPTLNQTRKLEHVNEQLFRPLASLLDQGKRWPPWASVWKLNSTQTKKMYLQLSREAGETLLNFALKSLRKDAAWVTIFLHPVGYPPTPASYIPKSLSNNNEENAYIE